VFYFFCRPTFFKKQFLPTAQVAHLVLLGHTKPTLRKTKRATFYPTLKDKNQIHTFEKKINEYRRI